MNIFQSRLQMISLQPVAWLIVPSFPKSLLLAFLITPMSLLIIFGLLSWLVFIYLLLNNRCPPQPLLLTFFMSLSNPNYSQSFNSILKTLMSLFSFTLSSYINMLKSELSTLSFASPNSFSVSCLREWYHHLVKVRTLGVIFHSS